MKITNSIAFFLVIFLPFLITWIIHTNDRHDVTLYNHKYDGALTTAVEDAAQSLKNTAKPNHEYSYVTKKYSNLNREAAYETFLRTMSSNFNIESPISIKELEYYVPIFGVIGYEGYSSNRFETVGNQLLRIWQPIQPYTYVDASGNIIRFTLDDYVYVYDRVSFDKPKWLEGTREMLINTFHSNILALQDATEFEQRRRQTIVLQIEKSIETELNLHNQTLSSYGYTYKFALPLITEETWDNTVDDVGIIAFVQGLPVHRLDMEYNQYAFAASRLLKTDTLYATTLNDGQRVFWPSSCNYSYPKTETYSTRKDAAKNGYRELSCLNM